MIGLQYSCRAPVSRRRSIVKPQQIMRSLDMPVGNGRMEWCNCFHHSRTLMAEPSDRYDPTNQIVIAHPRGAHETRTKQLLFEIWFDGAGC
jgi:hypothetical protein